MNTVKVKAWAIYDLDWDELVINNGSRALMIYPTREMAKEGLYQMIDKKLLRIIKVTIEHKVV